MFKTRNDTKKNYILKSGAAITVMAALGLVMVSDQRPVHIDIGEDAVLAVGLRLNQYAPVTQLPPWLALPDRSTAAYGSILPDTDSKRVYFRSLSSSRAIEEHFRDLLLANGYQLAYVRPAASVSGVTSLITAFDTDATRSVQITVREGAAVRSVEVSFRGPARIASKRLSIGS
jgi:hypothetical protein